MSQVVAFRPGTELQAKLQALREGLQQSTSTVLRQVLQVVSIEQLRQMSQGGSVEEKVVVTSGD